MIVETKLRKVGNSLGIVLPKEALSEIDVAEGDVIYLTRTAGGEIRMTPKSPEFAEKMGAAESIMRRYRNALTELAK